ncbi:MAG: hypothetical protein JNL74_02915 [Fibrobacteres bacterium]|nr:hypothetical protein [Fibrobacterota bacterium]
MNGRNNPSVDFKQFTTPHFKIIFQEGLDSMASRAATVAEAALPGLCRNLHVNENDIPVINIVLSDVDDVSNGFSSPVGQLIELFAPPFQAMTTGNIAWIDRVTVHELAHQITFLKLRKTFGLYSTIYYLLFTPTWLIEGIAQYESEEWDRNRDFLLRAAAANNALKRRERAHGFTGLDPIASRIVYEQGHSIYRFMVKQFGPDIGGRILGRLSVFSPTINSALMRTIRMNEATLFVRWSNAISEEYNILGLNNLISENREPSVRTITENVSQLYSFKRITGGAVFTGIERNSVYEENIYSYRTGYGLVRIDGPYIQSVFDLSPDGGSVLYSKMIRNSDGQLRYRIMRKDLDGKRRSMPYIEGESPVFISSDKIAFLITRKGRTSLYTASLSNGNKEVIVLPDSIINAYSLKFYDGRLYLSAMMTDGSRPIVSTNPDGSDFRTEITIQNADCRYPSFRNGKMAYMTNENGPFEVRIRAADGTTSTVASDDLGAFMPEFSDDDSISVIAFKRGDKPFQTSAYSVYINSDVRAVIWDTTSEWKKGRAFDASKVVDSTRKSAVSSYYGFPAQRAVLLMPTYIDEKALALNLYLNDPVGRHALQGGVILNAGNSAGWNAGYGAYWLDPDITVDAASYRYYSSVYELSDTLFHARLTSLRRVNFSAIKYLNNISDLRLNHALFFRTTLGKEDSKDTLISYKHQYTYDSSTTSEDIVHGTVGYSVGWQNSSTHADFYPLNSWSAAISTENARPSIGGIKNYNLLALDVKATKELARTNQVIAARIRSIGFYGQNNVTMSTPLALMPRGTTIYYDSSFTQLFSGNFEYRLPLTWDVGKNILGLYLEALSLAAFYDASISTLKPITDNNSLNINNLKWTAGALFRQRVLVFGKTFTIIEGTVYYDPLKSSENWDYSISFAGQANF